MTNTRDLRGPQHSESRPRAVFCFKPSTGSDSLQFSFQCLSASTMGQDQSPLRSARPFPSEENPVCFTYNETNEESDELRNTSYYCDLCKLLCVVFGFENWRPGQLAACVCAIEGKDVVITLATGFGKSLCYQVLSIQHFFPALPYAYTI